MKHKELRKLIREEIKSIQKENDLPSGATAVEFALVDKDEPYADDGPIFVGTLPELKNQLLLMLRGGELQGLDIMEKREWDEIRKDNLEEYGRRREIDDEYPSYGKAEQEYGWHIGKDPEEWDAVDWENFHQYQFDVKNGVADPLPDREMRRIKAGGYRRFKQ